MKTQAWGWLAAAVVAAGLNATYHDGGFEWAHQLAERVGHNSAAVLALASGRTDQFLAEARMVAARESGGCPWSTALARVQTRVARTDADFVRFQALSGGQEARLARLEANRVRIEAQVAAITARMQLPGAAFRPVSFRSPNLSVVCPRVHVRVPRPPMIRIPTPLVDVETPSAGPI